MKVLALQAAEKNGCKSVIAGGDAIMILELSEYMLDLVVTAPHRGIAVV
jgi:hypothetical protein